MCKVQRVMCDETALKSSLHFLIYFPVKCHSRHLQIVGKGMFFKVEDIMTFFTALCIFYLLLGNPVHSSLLALVIFAVS